MANNINFKLISLNTKGLRDKKKRIAVFRWLKRHDPDLVFLQETHTTSLDENQFRNEWGIGDVYYSHGKSNSKGVAILLNKSRDIEILDTIHTSQDGRVIILEANVQDTVFKLINIYAPNKEGEQIVFYNNIKLLLNKYEIDLNDNIVMGGDYNVIFDPKLDKKGGIERTKDAVLNVIDEIVTVTELHDIWRLKNPNKRVFTWRQKNPDIHCRLDHWFISDTLHDEVSCVDILPSIRSDHSAIVLSFKSLKNATRGRGHWKMNSSIIN